MNDADKILQSRLDEYFYPGTRVFKNKLGIENPVELKRAEELIVNLRMVELVQQGTSDHST